MDGWLDIAPRIVRAGLELWITACFFIELGLLCAFSTGIRLYGLKSKAKPLL